MRVRVRVRVCVCVTNVGMLPERKEGLLKFKMQM